MTQRESSARLAAVKKSKNRRIMISLFLNMFLVMAVIEAVNVIATVQFIGEIGLDLLPVLWMLNMGFVVLASASIAIIADRVRRIHLLRAFPLVVGCIFVGLRIVLYGEASVLAGYSALYVVGGQLNLLFPIIFWALANDIFSVAESQRLFPYLMGASLAGNVFGNLMGGVSVNILMSVGLAAADLLYICAAACLLATIIASVMLRGVRANVARKSEAGIAGMFVAWKTGFDFVRSVPLFRNISLTIFSGRFISMVALFFLLQQAQLRFTDVERLQVFFGSYKAIATAMALAVQVFLSARLLEKIGLQRIFYLVPGVLLVTSLVALIMPLLSTAVLQNLGRRITHRAVDESAVQSVLGLVPDERRGRVSIFTNIYVYALAVVVAGLMLLATIALRNTGVVNVQGEIMLYQAICVAMALVGLMAAQRLNTTYDDSLMNWRLRRKKRGRAVGLSGFYTDSEVREQLFSDSDEA